VWDPKTGFATLKDGKFVSVGPPPRPETRPEKLLYEPWDEEQPERVSQKPTIPEDVFPSPAELARRSTMRKRVDPVEGRGEPPNYVEIPPMIIVEEGQEAYDPHAAHADCEPHLVSHILVECTLLPLDSYSFTGIPLFEYDGLHIHDTLNRSHNPWRQFTVLPPLCCTSCSTSSTHPSYPSTRSHQANRLSETAGLGTAHTREDGEFRSWELQARAGPKEASQEREWISQCSEGFVSGVSFQEALGEREGGEGSQVYTKCEGEREGEGEVGIGGCAASVYQWEGEGGRYSRVERKVNINLVFVRYHSAKWDRKVG